MVNLAKQRRKQSLINANSQIDHILESQDIGFKIIMINMPENVY